MSLESELCLPAHFFFATLQRCSADPGLDNKTYHVYITPKREIISAILLGTKIYGIFFLILRKILEEMLMRT